jgi:hypothetical protein
MRRLVAICFLMSLCATPALASRASQQAAQLIKKGYARDVKRCKAKWRALRELCRAHPDPTIANNCGIPRPTTTSTTTTTEPTTTSILCTTIPTTTTTTLGCDLHSRVWSPCGPPGKGCTCHHFPGGANYQFICVDVGVQVQPVYLPCAMPVVSSDQECRDCLNEENNTNIVCIKGDEEPPRGACVELCP